MFNSEGGSSRPEADMSDTQPPLAFLLAGGGKNRYPRNLVAQFPHVAKRLDQLWDDPDALAEYFTDLMVSRRPNRRGFPPEVAAEIMSLSLACDKVGHIAPNEDRLGRSGPVRRYDWTNERAVKELDERGIPLTATAFTRAAEAGDHAVCSLFIHAGYDIDARDSRHWTPLMVAAFNGRESLALELVKFGADIDAEDIAGYTPLHWAAYNGFRSVVRLLLRRGAAPNVTSHAGITPLLQAAARGHLDTVADLLDHRADPNIAAKDGSTALLKAVANDHLDVVERLLEAGASTDVAMRDGTTLVEIARRTRDPALYRKIAVAAGLH